MEGQAMKDRNPPRVTIPEELEGYMRECIEIGLFGRTIEEVAIELMRESLRKHVAGGLFKFSHRITR
jgi:hypothetical protein